MTTPPPRPASESAEDIDEPLAQLLACHDHLRGQLQRLREIGQCVAAGRVDAGVHRTAADVLHYFDRAAPQHHEDEEQHIFPCVLAQAGDDVVRQAVLKLQEDHPAMEAQWARLRVALAALADGHRVAYDTSQIAAATRFCDLYERHARREEEIVFPVASNLLDPPARRRAGAEMVRRRAAGRT
jgi:hemerythrin-like domain-containing protein